MRFMPTLKNDDDLDLFDDVFSAPFFNREMLMKTDITEKDGKYDLSVELPRYKKEDVKISLYKGNLTIEASHNTSNDEKDEKGKVVRQERYSGSCSRTFYVGDSVKEDDVHASFNDGVLHISIPTETKQEKENTKFIGIE